MNNLVIAYTEADAAAVEAVEQHHAQMAGALALRVGTMVSALSRMDGDAAVPARDELASWCRLVLVPHAVAEEKALYPTARGLTEGRLLVDAMLAEHGVITRLVDEIARTGDMVRAGVAAGALLEIFQSHVAKENELLLPLLAGAPDVSVAELLDGMHELLGGEAMDGHGGEQQAGCGGHTCSCGEEDGPGYPELDARAIPHAIRHATIFGALDTVGNGSGLVLIAPHDPLPLLGQVEQRYAGAFTVEYIERGPEAWRLAFVRRAA